MCCRGRQGREMVKEKWEGIPNEYIFNSVEISHSKSTKRNKHFASTICLHHLNLLFLKKKKVFFFFLREWFLISQQTWQCILHQESKEETLTTDRQGQRGLWINTALHATHTTYTQPIDYPRCLYSHMPSIWILNSSKNMCQPSPICLSPCNALTIAEAQLM